MDSTPVIIFISGIALGAFVSFALMYIYYRRKLSDSAQLEKQISAMQEKVGKLPMDMLSVVSSQLARQNEQVIANERALSALELDKVNQTVTSMSALVRELEKDREQKFGELSSAIASTINSHKELADLTTQLHSVIYHKQSRGQWGERMAEDILRLAGFQEGVNYHTQRVMDTGYRPDFTFVLPKGYILNMDVKFPLDNYSKYVDAESDIEKDRYISLFMSDVKKHIKSITSKEYISPSENTVDYVVMFIPSDLVYTAIFQQDPVVIDDALKQKVVLCSPATLYAVLAVIRQAADNYALERSTSEILTLMDNFTKEWAVYSDKVDNLGKRIDAVVKEYTELASTRTQKLDKPVQAFAALIKGHNNACEDDE